jgi:hypothetical protein
MRTGRLLILAVLLIESEFFLACGIKGPPRPPATPVPDQARALAGRSREGCVELKWKTPAESVEHAPVTQWEVLRAPAPAPGSDALYEVIATAPETTYRDCTPPAEAATWYAVRGLSATGARGKANGPIKTMTLQPPGAPAITRTEPNNGFIEFVWDAPAASEGATIGYNVYRSTDPAAFPWLPANPQPLGVTSYADGPLVNGTRYFYEVRAARLTAAGLPIEGPAATTAATPADRKPPSAPQGLAAAGGPDGVNLRWLKNPEADIKGYLVYRRVEGESAFKLLVTAPIPAPMYLDKSARKGVIYEYAVTAVDSADPPNSSPFSSPQSAYIAP